MTNISTPVSPACPFNRRDLLKAGAAGSALGLAPPGATPAQAAPEPVLPSVPGEPDGYYPPLRTGMRGSHPGSFTIGHALRDGEAIGRSLSGPAEEDYDLIVVGAGISGLAAALFYRDRNPQARVLILDNHDDFGGHAKRNEFTVRGHTLLMNGGTLAIESPTPYSPTAEGLMRRLGIDAKALAERYGSWDEEPAKAALDPAVFFDAAQFGRDALVRTPPQTPLQEALRSAPLSPAALAEIAALETRTSDPLGTMPMAQRKDYLSRISFRDYLVRHAGLGEEAVKLYQDQPLGWWTVGGDGISALDAWGMNYFKGFNGLKLDPGAHPRMGYTPRGYSGTGGSPDFHFPDGNASVARLMVGQLVPAFFGRPVDAASVVLAQGHYAALDRPGQPTRIRLSSTAVRVVNRPGGGVDVVYARPQQPDSAEGAVLRKVAGRHVVLACWAMIIPYLMPELPARQQEALHELVKEPLVYVSVALDNWRAFAKAGVGRVRVPGGWYNNLRLDRAVPIGGYQGPATPDEPILLHAERIPNAPGLPEHDQSRAGRADLLATDLATFEGRLTDLLTRAFGAHGFDARRDIAAITVNRWGHGYSPEYNSLWDAKRDDEPDAPHKLARVRFGAVAIANADVGRAAYTDSAIDQAARAVSELLPA